MSLPPDMTQILQEWNQGDSSALDKLFPLVYDELHQIASRYLRRERPDHTLQTTALVHEAYLKLLGEQDLQWQNRAHFFGVAARMMRHILVNHALALKTEKRGGGHKVTLNEVIGVPDDRQNWEILALNQALTKLEAMDQRKSKVVELKFFAGLSNEEVAAVLGISLATMNREWRLTRAWLVNEIKVCE